MDSLDPRDKKPKKFKAKFERYQPGKGSFINFFGSSKLYRFTTYFFLICLSIFFILSYFFIMYYADYESERHFFVSLHKFCGEIDYFLTYWYYFITLHIQYYCLLVFGWPAPPPTMDLTPPTSLIERHVYPHFPSVDIRSFWPNLDDHIKLFNSIYAACVDHYYGFLDILIVLWKKFPGKALDVLSGFTEKAFNSLHYVIAYVWRWRKNITKSWESIYRFYRLKLRRAKKAGLKLKYFYLGILVGITFFLVVIYYILLFIIHLVLGSILSIAAYFQRARSSHYEFIRDKRLTDQQLKLLRLTRRKRMLRRKFYQYFFSTASFNRFLAKVQKFRDSKSNPDLFHKSTDSSSNQNFTNFSKNSFTPPSARKDNLPFEDKGRRYYSTERQDSSNSGQRNGEGPDPVEFENFRPRRRINYKLEFERLLRNLYLYEYYAQFKEEVNQHILSVYPWQRDIRTQKALPYTLAALFQGALNPNFVAEDLFESRMRPRSFYNWFFRFLLKFYKPRSRFFYSPGLGLTTRKFRFHYEDTFFRLYRDTTRLKLSTLSGRRRKTYLFDFFDDQDLPFDDRLMYKQLVSTDFLFRRLTVLDERNFFYSRFGAPSRFSSHANSAKRRLFWPTRFVRLLKHRFFLQKARRFTACTDYCFNNLAARFRTYYRFKLYPNIGMYGAYKFRIAFARYFALRYFFRTYARARLLRHLQTTPSTLHSSVSSSVLDFSTTFYSPAYRKELLRLTRTRRSFSFSLDDTHPHDSDDGQYGQIANYWRHDTPYRGYLDYAISSHPNQYGNYFDDNDLVSTPEVWKNFNQDSLQFWASAITAAGALSWIRGRRQSAVQSQLLLQYSPLFIPSITFQTQSRKNFFSFPYLYAVEYSTFPLYLYPDQHDTFEEQEPTDHPPKPAAHPDSDPDEDDHKYIQEYYEADDVYESWDSVRLQLSTAYTGWYINFMNNEMEHGAFEYNFLPNLEDVDLRNYRWARNYRLADYIRSRTGYFPQSNLEWFHSEGLMSTYRMVIWNLDWGYFEVHQQLELFELAEENKRRAKIALQIERHESVDSLRTVFLKKCEQFVSEYSTAVADYEKELKVYKQLTRLYFTFYYHFFGRLVRLSKPIKTLFPNLFDVPAVIFLRFSRFVKCLFRFLVSTARDFWIFFRSAIKLRLNP